MRWIDAPCRHEKHLKAPFGKGDARVTLSLKAPFGKGDARVTLSAIGVPDAPLRGGERRNGAAIREWSRLTAPYERSR